MHHGNAFSGPILRTDEELCHYIASCSSRQSVSSPFWKREESPRSLARSFALASARRRCYSQSRKSIGRSSNKKKELSPFIDITDCVAPRSFVHPSRVKSVRRRNRRSGLRHAGGRPCTSKGKRRRVKGDDEIGHCGLERTRRSQSAPMGIIMVHEAFDRPRNH